MGSQIYIVLLILEGVVSKVYAFGDVEDYDYAFEELCKEHGLAPESDEPWNDDVGVLKWEVVLNELPPGCSREAEDDGEVEDD